MRMLRLPGSGRMTGAMSGLNFGWESERKSIWQVSQDVSKLVELESNESSCVMSTFGLPCSRTLKHVIHMAVEQQHETGTH